MIKFLINLKYITQLISKWNYLIISNSLHPYLVVKGVQPMNTTILIIALNTNISIIEAKQLILEYDLDKYFDSKSTNKEELDNLIQKKNLLSYERNFLNNYYIYLRYIKLINIS